MSMMSVDEAANILLNKKDHWSHEIDEAKETAELAFLLFVAMSPKNMKDKIEKIMED